MKRENEDSWYVGPLTKRRVAELRKKLGIARGMIDNVREAIEHGEPLPTPESLARAMKETIDP